MVLKNNKSKVKKSDLIQFVFFWWKSINCNYWNIVILKEEKSDLWTSFQIKMIHVIYWLKIFNLKSPFKSRIYPCAHNCCDWFIPLGYWINFCILFESLINRKLIKLIQYHYFIIYWIILRIMIFNPYDIERWCLNILPYFY